MTNYDVKQIQRIKDSITKHGKYYSLFIPGTTIIIMIDHYPEIKYDSGNVIIK